LTGVPLSSGEAGPWACRTSSAARTVLSTSSNSSRGPQQQGSHPEVVQARGCPQRHCQGRARHWPGANRRSLRDSHSRTTPNSAGHAAYPLTWANSEFALFRLWRRPAALVSHASSIPRPLAPINDGSPAAADLTGTQITTPGDRHEVPAGWSNEPAATQSLAPVEPAKLGTSSRGSDTRPG
jgi:hypothetical protein